MSYSPTGLLLDQRPAWGFTDVARPISQIPDIGASPMGDQGWGGGVDLWWLHDRIYRRRSITALDDANYPVDDDIATIGDPAVWPDDISGAGLPDIPGGLKAPATEPDTTKFRAFTVYAPLVSVDLEQDIGDPHDRAEQQLLAHVDAQLAAEFADSLYTKNPGLYRTAADVSGAAAVHPVVAFSLLRKNYAQANDPNGATGDAVISVPDHAVPFLVHLGIATWTSDGRLVDCWGQPLNTGPGQILRGPLTDADDLETSQDPDAAPGGETGWFYISPTPYFGLGPFRPSPDAMRARGGDRGVWPYGNEARALAEARAIVVFRPTLTFAIEVDLNATLL